MLPQILEYCRCFNTRSLRAQNPIDFLNKCLNDLVSPSNGIILKHAAFKKLKGLVVLLGALIVKSSWTLFTCNIKL